MAQQIGHGKARQWLLDPTSFKAFQKTCKKAFKKAGINHINNVIQKGLNENNPVTLNPFGAM